MAPSGLELVTLLSRLSLPNSRITGMWHHTYFLLCIYLFIASICGVCSLVCVYGWADTHENAGVGPELILDFFLDCTPLHLLKQGLSLNLEPLVSACPAWGSSVSTFWALGFQAAVMHAWLLWGLALTLMKQVVYPQIHLSSPNLFIYNIIFLC